MFLRFGILFLALLFAANLYAAANFESYSTWIGMVFSLVLMIAARITVKKWKYSVLPILLVPGSVILLFLIDSVSLTRLFAVLSSLVFYFSILAGWRLAHYEKDLTAKAMYNFAAVAVVFCWFSAGFGWYLNVAVPIWGLMIILAVVAFLVSASSFAVNQIQSDKSLVFSIFLASIVAETVLVQNFWPFGYLTMAAIALIIYFVGWEIIINYLLGKMSVRAVVFELFFLAGSVSLILLSTNWYPIV